MARALEAVLGPDLPIAVRAYDGSRLGPADAPATLLVRSPAVFRRLITAPGELGLGRAYVSGELDVEGDLYAALAALRDRIPDVRAFGPRQWAEVLRLAGTSVLRTGFGALPVPPEEARLGGVRHSKERDAALLDIGCGWGGMVLHAAANHGVRAVGVTLSRRQADWAEKAVAEAGLADLVEIRHRDRPLRLPRRRAARGRERRLDDAGHGVRGPSR